MLLVRVHVHGGWESYDMHLCVFILVLHARVRRVLWCRVSRPPPPSPSASASSSAWEDPGTKPNLKNHTNKLEEA